MASTSSSDPVTNGNNNDEEPLPPKRRKLEEEEKPYPSGIYSTGLAGCYSSDLIGPLSDVPQYSMDFNDHGYKLKLWAHKLADEKRIDIEAQMKFRYLFKDELFLKVFVKLEEDIKTEVDFVLAKNESIQVFYIDLKAKFSDVDFDRCTVVAEFGCRPLNIISDDWGTEVLIDDENRVHNVVLVVEDKKFYVLKEYLASWSRYFDNMFFGNYKEKDQKEVKLEDIDPMEFRELLLYIHPSRSPKIHEENVIYLLKLADRFDMPSVMSSCAAFLARDQFTTSISLMDRIELAEKHNLVTLQIDCCERFARLFGEEAKNFKKENRDRIRMLQPDTLKNLLLAY